MYGILTNLLDTVGAFCVAAETLSTSIYCFKSSLIYTGSCVIIFYNFSSCIYMYIYIQMCNS